MISLGIATVVCFLLSALYSWKRFGDLVVENRALRNQSEEIARMKKNFISYVSHELKAPLASMQETTHLLLEQIPGPLTEKQRRLLELNMLGGKRLSGMIGNMLDLSRLEAGTVDFDMGEEDIAGLLQELVTDRAVDARDLGIHLELNNSGDPLVVSCDYLRLRQLLDKILDNAFHFSKKDNTIRVDASFADDLPPRVPARLRRHMLREKHQNGFAVISVSDSGPGIEDSQKEKVFEVFSKWRDGKIKSGQSLGLGLAIASVLAEAHRGVIWVEDNPAGGSVFCLLLPLAKGRSKVSQMAS